MFLIFALEKHQKLFFLLFLFVRENSSKRLKFTNLFPYLS